MAPNCFLNNADILLSVWTHSTVSISVEKGTEEGVKLSPHTRNHVFQGSIYLRHKFFGLSPHQQLSPRKQGEHVRDLLNRGLLECISVKRLYTRVVLMESWQHRFILTDIIWWIRKIICEWRWKEALRLAKKDKKYWRNKIKKQL